MSTNVIPAKRKSSGSEGNVVEEGGPQHATRSVVGSGTDEGVRADLAGFLSPPWNNDWSLLLDRNNMGPELPTEKLPTEAEEIEDENIEDESTDDDLTSDLQAKQPAHLSQPSPFSEHIPSDSLFRIPSSTLAQRQATFAGSSFGNSLTEDETLYISGSVTSRAAQILRPKVLKQSSRGRAAVQKGGKGSDAHLAKALLVPDTKGPSGAKRVPAATQNISNGVYFVRLASSDPRQPTDAVLLPSEWADGPLPTVDFGRKEEGRVFVSLKEADETKFNAFNQKDARSRLMSALAPINVKVRIFIKGFEVDGPDGYIDPAGYTVSAGSALLLILHFKSPQTMASMADYSTPRIMQELALLGRGRFIPDRSAPAAFSYIVAAIVDSGHRRKRQLADAGGELVLFCLRHKRTDDTEGFLKRQLKCLLHYIITDLTKDSSSAPAEEQNLVKRKVAVSCSLIIAGTLKRISQIGKSVEDRKWWTRTILHVGLSFLGFAPAGAAVAGTLVGIAADGMMDKFWKNPAGPLQRVVHDLVLDAIYWPLLTKGEIAFAEKVHFDQEATVVFRAWFELVLQSNHV